MSSRSFNFSPFQLLCFALAILPAAASANSVVPQCDPNGASLASYEHNFSGCAIGILDFRTFTFSSSSSTPGDVSAPHVDSDTEIKVTPGNNGFTFSQVSGAPFSVSTGQIVTYNIGYQFVIDPAPVLEGADLTLDPPSGLVTVTQTYCVDSIFSPPNSCVGTNQVSPQTLTVTSPGKPHDSKVFNPPANSFGSVQTQIVLDGTLGPASFDSVIGSATVVGASTLTPEPGSIGLALGGLLVLCGMRRRKI